MLHILNKQHKGAGVAQAIMSKRQPDGSIDLASEDKEPESAPDSLEAVAHDMMEAFKADDVKALAAAFRAGFELLESEPHEEAPSVSESLESLK